MVVPQPPISSIFIPDKAIAQFCQRNHIRKLSLFGSVLRDDFTPQSDVDVLVEFEPGYAPGFLGLSRLQRELTELIGHQVDLRTPNSLSQYFRADVEAAAIPIYVA
jgi:predicted nucleotidyltransferase